VQLVGRLVRHEVAPSPAAPPPARLVDEHGHGAQPGTGDVRAGDRGAILVAARPPPGDTGRR
jgi:hypothetical protein